MIILSRSACQAPCAPSLPSPATDHIPSLSWICIQHIARLYEHFDSLDPRLNYLSDTSDVLQGQGPIDPRLWLTLIQIYDNLPIELHTINLPLADVHLPQIQRVPSDPRFSLITILDLPVCPHLTDASILQLRHLHSLAALDASATSLTSYGIKVLSDTLQKANGYDHRSGPWPLRILRLRHCRHIDSSIYKYLPRFPLLTVVDLRGTNCRPISDNGFQPCSNAAFFHPSPLSIAIDMLPGQDLYSSVNIFKVFINTLHHPKAMATKPTHIPRESYVFVPSRHNDPNTKRYAPYQNRKSHVGQELITSRRQREPSGGTQHAQKYVEHESPRDYEDFGDSNRQSSKDKGSKEMGSPTSAFHPLITRPNDSIPHLSEPDSPSLAGPSLLPHPISESTPEAFYHQPMKMLPPKYDPATDYSAEMHYARSNTNLLRGPSNPYDSELALYRTPPPWKTLDLCSKGIPKEQPQRGTHKPEKFASVNRARMSLQIGQARMDALRESAARKSAMDGLRLAQSNLRQDKNPFRRHSTSSLDETLNGSIKPLKPISSLKVPPLPAGHEPHPGNQKSTIATPRASTNKASLASSFTCNGDSVSIRKPLNSAWVGFHRSPPKETGESRFRKNRIKVRKDEHVPGRGISSHFCGRKEERSSYPSRAAGKAFDWGSWSKAGK